MAALKMFGRAIRLAGRTLFPGVAVRADGVSVDEMAAVARHRRSARRGDKLLVDVGAHHGHSLEPFLRMGWSVYAFEPDSSSRSHLAAKFSDAQDLTIDSRALSDEGSSNSVLYRSPVSTGISSLRPFHDTHEQAETVEVTTLSQIWSETGIKSVSVLKVDVEGYDLPVLKGNDWERVRPDVIVCEFEDRKSLPLGYNFDDLCEFLLKHSYRLLVSEWFPVEEYGSSHRFRRISHYPTRKRHPDSWGNIIATTSRWSQLRLWSRLWMGTALGRLVLRFYSAKTFR